MESSGANRIVSDYFMKQIRRDTLNIRSKSLILTAWRKCVRIKRAVLNKIVHITILWMMLFLPLAAYAETPYHSPFNPALLEVAQQGPLPSPAG